MKEKIAEQLALKNNGWIPVKSRIYPQDSLDVQVTYLDKDGASCCNAFAFLYDNTWYWSRTDTEVEEEIIAWKKENCEPYRER